jgi:hypothetical protein
MASLLPSSSMKTIAEPGKLELGTSLPPGDRHVSDKTHHHHVANPICHDILTNYRASAFTCRNGKIPSAGHHGSPESSTQ